MKQKNSMRLQAKVLRRDTIDLRFHCEVNNQDMDLHTRGHHLHEQ
jgi:hypothetical protein